MRPSFETDPRTQKQYFFQGIKQFDVAQFVSRRIQLLFLAQKMWRIVMSVFGYARQSPPKGEQSRKTVDARFPCAAGIGRTFAQADPSLSAG
jgi:hypothetical protein